MPKYTEYQKVFRIGKSNAGKVQCQSRTRDRSRRPQWSSDTTQQGGTSNGGLDSTTNLTDGRLSENGKERETVVDHASKLSEAQRRLQHLEKVVASLVDANAVPPGISDHLTPPYGDQFADGIGISEQQESHPPESPKTPLNGRLNVRGVEANYCGGTHWETILSDIKDIQDCLVDEVEHEVSENLISTSVEVPDIVFGASEALSLEEACELLPSRHVVDKLLSVYFSAHYLHIPFIHRGKFLKEYELFWKDPSSVPYLWVSLLFSALDLGSWLCYMHEGSELPNDIPPRSLLKTAGQILVTGQYQKARPYSVEAVLLFGICKFLQKVDPDTEPWLVIGVAARMALRMGYHRDPQYLPHISPFQGEMRRRTFSILQAFDLLLSFQAGLPATLHEDACDTDLPRNLFDEDFDEDSTVIPPSRPLTVPTPMIYHCFKGRLCRSFRPVARLALSPRAPSYEDIMKADAELRKAHASIPPSLAMRPLSLSITDEVHVIQHRFNVDLVYQTGMMILHRTYISHQRSNPTFEYSRKTCIKASLSMLKWQADLHLATLPGGQLHNSSRFIASSLIQHDFLLAAMVACLDLYESHRRSEIDKITDAEFEAHKDIYNALKFSHQIWMSRSSSSRDAKRASAILGVMMAKIPDPSVARGSKTNTLPAGSFDQDHSVLGSTTPGMLTLSLSPFPKEQAQPFTSILENEETGFSESGAFEALLRDEEVNWNLVDQYLFGRGAGLDEFWMREL